MADLFVLRVLLHDERVGAITLLPGDQSFFTFEQQYIDNPDRPTLSLSFKDALGGLITDQRPTRVRLPPFFANLLPEGPLRELLARRARVSPSREFFLLWALGRDLPGAVTIRASDDEAWPLDEEEGRDSEAAQQRRREHALRFSLAGVQLKFSAVAAATGGLTIPARGVGGDWIVKLPSLRFASVPENEYAMMKMAKAVGLEVPDVRLVALDAISGLPSELRQLGGSALAVARFDRLATGEHVHIEDFAQVFGVYPEHKYRRASYRNLAEVIWAESGEAGIAELVRRLVFCVLIGNGDMHLKNWSLIYRDRRRPELAPGYDFVSTVGYLADDDMALRLGRTKSMTQLSLEDLAYFAAKARLPTQLVLENARLICGRFMDTWRTEKQDLPMPEWLVKNLDQHLAKLRLPRECRGHGRT